MQLTADDLIWPIFVIDGDRAREEVEAMPGVARLSIDLAVKAAEDAAEIGIPAIALFPNLWFSRKLCYLAVSADSWPVAIPGIYRSG